jgi:hypothetical protein
MEYPERRFQKRQRRVTASDSRLDPGGRCVPVDPEGDPGDEDDERYYWAWIDPLGQISATASNVAGLAPAARSSKG